MTVAEPHHKCRYKQDGTLVTLPIRSIHLNPSTQHGQSLRNSIRNHVMLRDQILYPVGLTSVVSDLRIFPNQQSDGI
ncbi:uncharacterized protein RAG0_10849 [Rhynchosporium agropyri]|uniref:Uncharacterized protein n=1 Tax=Rhynchosporium agropyri TaxID=914238 RepID=A0A1E1L433_9HELO|nr:uncharacterized protein RAG0_10849 [Rhynchosporium agropyri]